MEAPGRLGTVGDLGALPVGDESPLGYTTVVTLALASFAVSALGAGPSFDPRDVTS